MSDLINGIIPWLLPGVMILSLLVNYTHKWEKGGEGESAKKQPKKAAKKEEKSSTPSAPPLESSDAGGEE